MVEYRFNELNNIFDTEFQTIYTLTAHSWAIWKRSNSETENFLTLLLHLMSKSVKLEWA